MLSLLINEELRRSDIADAVSDKEQDGDGRFLCESSHVPADDAEADSETSGVRVVEPEADGPAPTVVTRERVEHGDTDDRRELGERHDVEPHVRDFVSENAGTYKEDNLDGVGRDGQELGVDSGEAETFDEKAAEVRKAAGGDGVQDAEKEKYPCFVVTEGLLDLRPLPASLYTGSLSTDVIGSMELLVFSEEPSLSG